MTLADGNNQNSMQGRARTTAKRNRPGGGQNSKGSWSKGKKGLFQYGTGQFGFINPAGQIDWSADAAKAQKAPLFGYGSVRSHARKTGQVAPPQPPVYMTPALQNDLSTRESSGERDHILNSERAWQSLGLRYNTDLSKGNPNFGVYEANKDNPNSDYAAHLNAITRALGDQLPGVTSNISGSGFDPSEGAGAGIVKGMIDDADSQSSEMKRQRQNALEILSAENTKYRGEYDEGVSTLHKAAKDTYAKEHKGRIGKPKGFSVKNVNGVKQYFYSNGKGSTVSADPVKARAAIAKAKKKGK